MDFFDFMARAVQSTFKGAMTGSGIDIAMSIMLVLTAAALLFAIWGVGQLVLRYIGEAMAEDQTCEAVIIDRHYTPGYTSTGVGTGIGANGTVTPVVTTSYVPAEFDLEFEVNGGSLNGMTGMFSIAGAHFGRYREGDAVRLTFRVPRFVGGISWREIEHLDSAHRLKRNRNQKPGKKN